MHDVYKFYGEKKPEWNPYISTRLLYDPYARLEELPDNGFFILADNFLSRQECDDLIYYFEKEEKHPVGVNGYTEPSDDIGSYRTNAWADHLTHVLSPQFRKVMSKFNLDKLQGNQGQFLHNFFDQNKRVMPTPFEVKDQTYTCLGNTPYMRFMKYENEGKHVPHFDAPFVNDDERFLTLFSWVLYLNDAEGGTFEFVHSGQEHLPMKDRDYSDWENMHTVNDMITKVEPKKGRLLIFPHWICHGVQEVKSVRFSIRGDLAYGY